MVGGKVGERSRRARATNSATKPEQTALGPHRSQANVTTPIPHLANTRQDCPHSDHAHLGLSRRCKDPPCKPVRVLDPH